MNQERSQKVAVLSDIVLKKNQDGLNSFIERLGKHGLEDVFTSNLRVLVNAQHGPTGPDILDFICDPEVKITSELAEMIAGAGIDLITPDMQQAVFVLAPDRRSVHSFPIEAEAVIQTQISRPPDVKNSATVSSWIRGLPSCSGYGGIAYAAQIQGMIQVQAELASDPDGILDAAGLPDLAAKSFVTGTLKWVEGQNAHTDIPDQLLIHEFHTGLIKSLKHLGDDIKDTLSGGMAKLVVTKEDLSGILSAMRGCVALFSNEILTFDGHAEEQDPRGDFNPDCPVSLQDIGARIGFRMMALKQPLAIALQDTMVDLKYAETCKFLGSWEIDIKSFNRYSEMQYLSHPSEFSSPIEKAPENTQELRLV